MALLDLPHEIIQAIINEVMISSTRGEKLRLLAVNRTFAILTAKGVTKLDHPRYRKQSYLPPEPPSSSVLCESLMSLRSEDKSSDLYALSTSIAVLMQCPALRFIDVEGDVAVQSRGFQADHQGTPTHVRYIMIVQALADTVICALDFDKDYLISDQLNYRAAFDRKECFLPHDPYHLAIATAMRMGDVTATLALLNESQQRPQHNGRRLPRKAPWRSCRYINQTCVNGSCFLWELCFAFRFGTTHVIASVVEYWIHSEDPRWAASRSIGAPWVMLKNACLRGSLEVFHLLPSCATHDFKGLVLCEWETPEPVAVCRCQKGFSGECEGRIAIFECLRNSISDRLVQSKFFKSTLRAASKSGCVPLVRHLINQGPWRIGRFPQTWRHSPLISAASFGHVSLMEYLLAAGAEAHSIFFLGSWCWDDAAFPNLELLAFLIDENRMIADRGKLVERRAAFIMHTAVKKDCYRVVRYLLRSGYDIWSDNHGTDLLRHAVEHRSQKTIGIFEQLGFTQAV